MGCCSTGNAAVRPENKTFNKQETAAIHFNHSNFVTAGSGKITESYKIGRLLGQGAYGKVCLAIHKQTKAQRAVKIIDKTQLNSTPEEKKAFFDEVELLKTIDHPNIIKIYEFHEDERKYYIVTDFCPGGELFDYMSGNTNISQTAVARIIF